jgi:predicted RNA-binding protein Jag
MRSVEATGKDIEEAVANALEQMGGTERDSVDIDILEQAKGRRKRGSA